MAEWISLMDYAMKKGVSLSTLRRHIKAGKIQYRVEHGRYLLYTGDTIVPTPAPNVTSSSDDFLILQLQSKLKKAQEEIAELKSLVAVYEETFNKAAPQSTAPQVGNHSGPFNFHGNS